jgi:hypothetical protein
MPAEQPRSSVSSVPVGVRVNLVSFSSLICSDPHITTLCLNSQCRTFRSSNSFTRSISQSLHDVLGSTGREKLRQWHQRRCGWVWLIAEQRYTLPLREGTPKTFEKPQKQEGDGRVDARDKFGGETNKETRH